MNANVTFVLMSDFYTHSLTLIHPPSRQGRAIIRVPEYIPVRQEYLRRVVDRAGEMAVAWGEPQGPGNDI